MSHANAVFSGILVKSRIDQDESGKDILRGLLIIEEGKPGVILEIYGKAIDTFPKDADSPVVVVGSARLAPDSKQNGLKQDLVVNVRQFAIADGQINSLSITGNLGRDPEIKYLIDKSVASFSLGVDTWINKKAKKTSWFDITAWGKDADLISNYCKEGYALSIPFATAKIEEWTDKTSGELVKKWKFTANRIDLHSRKENEASSSVNQKQKSVSRITKEVAEKHGDLDEIPF